MIAPSRSRRIACTFALLVAMSVHAGAQDQPPVPPPPAINFMATLDAALESAGQNRRPVIVYFTAAWCGWCERMSASTFTDAQVRRLAEQYVWAKVDVDAMPAVAKQYEVAAVPTIVVLNADGKPLKRQAGFIPASQMTDLLRQFADQAEALSLDEQLVELTRQVETMPVEAPLDIRRRLAARVAEQIAQPDPRHREALRKAIVSRGGLFAEPLLDLLSDPRLSARAAVADLLIAVTRSPLTYDAFAEPDQRAAMIEQWRMWLTDHTPPSMPPIPRQSPDHKKDRVEA